VTHDDIDFLKSKAEKESTRGALDELVETEDIYDQQVIKKRLSFLDLLSKYRDINISLGDFLRRLQPMRARQVCPRGCSVMDCHLQQTDSVLNLVFTLIYTQYIQLDIPGAPPRRLQWIPRPSSAVGWALYVTHQGSARVQPPYGY
jgi:hypothetical protein